MSRHRNVRTMDYSEEYEVFDEVYGHSVEDDYCISPSDAAQFMFDRSTRQPQMSAFFNEENDIAEEDESNIEGSKHEHCRRDSDNYLQPGLSEVDEARLRSCLDEIRNVIGDSLPEHVLIKTVLKNEFNFKKALDAVLNSAASTTDTKAADAPKPQRERRNRDRDDYLSNSPHYYPMSVNDVKSLRMNIEKLDIRDTLELGQTSDLSGRKDNSNYTCLHSVPSTFENTSKICEHYDRCNTNLSSLTSSVSVLPVRSQMSILGTGISKELPKNNDLDSSGHKCPIKISIPRFKMKVRKDSEKENFTEDDNGSLLCLKSHSYNEINTEIDYSVSLDHIVHKHLQTVLPLHPAEESISLSSHVQLTNKHSPTKKLSPSEIENKSSSVSQIPEEGDTSHLTHLMNPNLKAVDTDSLTELVKNHKDTKEKYHFSEFTNNPTTSLQTQSSDDEKEDSFSLLANLGNRHSKMLQGKYEISSLHQLSSKHTNKEELSSEEEGESFSSLAILANRHLKVSEIKPCKSEGQVLSLSEFASHHLKIHDSNNGSVKEKSDNENTAYLLSSCSTGADIQMENTKDTLDISRLSSAVPFLKDFSPVVKTMSEDETEADWVIDLTSALTAPRSKLFHLIPKTPDKVSMSPAHSPKLNLDFKPNVNILNQRFPIHKKTPSLFGKILCKKWRHLQIPYIKPRN